MMCKQPLTIHKKMGMAIFQQNIIYKNRSEDGEQIWSTGHSLLTSEVDHQVFSNLNFSYSC